jgi:hypothetical protein
VTIIPNDPSAVKMEIGIERKTFFNLKRGKARRRKHRKIRM